MSLSAGTKLGRYEIRSKIGEGGMGEVYRARDEKLNRDVAIKVLPAELSTNGDRLNRFEQEAQAAGGLNHPNILVVYDVGMHQSAPYVVSELLEGETLRELLDQRSLAIRKATDYAIQITHGLSAAHDKGIVHRDLKPENIFITANDNVKILDFGLAKLTEANEADVPQTDIPTRKVHTEPGTVMGTVGYMSPEQVRAQAVDHRGDIFSFGSILYEMLTGQRAFRRDTKAEAMAAILKEEPPELSLTNSAVSWSLEKIVRRCLEKEPPRRFQTASDLAFALEALSTPSGSPQSIHGTSAPAFPAEASEWSAPKRRERIAWFAAGFFLLAALGLLLFTIVRSRRATTSSAPVVRYEVSAPAKISVNSIRWPTIAISPDGSTLVFAATSDGVPRLYLRRRNDAAVKPLPGTEGATNPAFSPDGKSLAFIADFNLKRMSLDGPVTTVAKVADSRGLAWANEDTLVYAPDSDSPLFQISIGGGQPRQITRVEAAKKERTHRWLQVLPGGKTVIFTLGMLDSPDDYEKASIDAVNLITGERRTVFQGASMARYASTGHLIFARGGGLYAIRFNPETLTTNGPAEPVLQGVAGDATTGAAQFAISDDGTLVYVPGDSGANLRRLYWATREGKAQPIDLPPGQYNDIRLSPDGSRLALLTGSSGSGDAWVYDFARGTSTRLTFNVANASPVWSADGKDIFYSQIDNANNTNLMRKPADGSREAESLASIASDAYIKAITASGAAAIVDYKIQTGRSDIGQINLANGSEVKDIVNTPFNEYAGALSRDARWLAYQSNENGRPEIYVRDLTATGARWQVTTEGGEEPHWSPDGRELYYRNGGSFIVVAVTTQPTFHFEKPKELFKGIYDLRSNSGVTYDVDPKGGRFLMIRLAQESNPVTEVRVILNWSEELRRLLPPR